jgi:hypothetical protein
MSSKTIKLGVRDHQPNPFPAIDIMTEDVRSPSKSENAQEHPPSFPFPTFRPYYQQQAHHTYPWLCDYRWPCYWRQYHYQHCRLPVLPYTAPLSTCSWRSTRTQDYQVCPTAVRQGRDTRTTLMAKNLPNLMTVYDLNRFINDIVPGAIDVIYMPMDLCTGKCPNHCSTADLVP